MIGLLIKIFRHFHFWIRWSNKYQVHPQALNNPKLDEICEAMFLFVCLFLRHWTPGSGEQWALKDRKQILYLRCFSCLFALRRPAAMVWAALWRGPYDMEQRRPLAKSQQDTEVLSPTVHKECNPTNNHVSEPGSGSSPSQAFRW